MNFDYEREKQNIKIEYEKYEKLKKAFSTISSAEGKASHNRKEYFGNMDKINEMDNDNLKKIYENFTKGMKDLEDDREVHLKKLKELIIPVTEFYPEEIKKSKQALEDYASQKKNTDDLTKSTRSNQEDINRSRNAENQKINQYRKTYNTFKENMRNDNKCLFLQFIHSELKYHCAALERMSNLFFEINKINPNNKIKKLAESLNVTNFDFKALGLDIKKIDEDNEDEEKEEKKEKGKVFDEHSGSEENEGEDSEEEKENDTGVKKSKKSTKNSLLKKSKNKSLKKSSKNDEDGDNDEEE